MLYPPWEMLDTQPSFVFARSTKMMLAGCQRRDQIAVVMQNSVRLLPTLPL